LERLVIDHADATNLITAQDRWRLTERCQDMLQGFFNNLTLTLFNLRYFWALFSNLNMHLFCCMLGMIPSIAGTTRLHIGTQFKSTPDKTLSTKTREPGFS